MDKLMDSIRLVEPVKESCLIMCKDTKIYEVELYGENIQSIIVTKKYTEFIISPVNIVETFKNRTSVFNRLGIDSALDSIGIKTKLDLLNLTHGVSLSDCLWLKFEGESITWKDVNPYKVDHVFDLGWFIEKSNPIYKLVLPNYSTDGTFPKCWITEDGKHKLIKAGTRGAYNAGLEPLSEILFTQIAEAIGYTNYVRYKPYIIQYNGNKDFTVTGIVRDNTFVTKGRLASICEVFTSEDYSLVTAKELGLDSYESCIDYAERYTYNPMDMVLMLMCDCIGMNEDRHFGNIGFLYNTETFKIESVAPMYDNNLSLLCYWDDRISLDDYYKELYAKDGKTFRELMVMLLERYSCLKENLISTLNNGIEFKCRLMCKERLDILNKIVNNNIKLYL